MEGSPAHACMDTCHPTWFGLTYRRIGRIILVVVVSTVGTTWYASRGVPSVTLSLNILFMQRDEDIDMSYEGLLSLSSLLGDVKPRGTPSDIVSTLPKGTYGEWACPGETEERCPICLDDVRRLSIVDADRGYLTFRISSTSPLTLVYAFHLVRTGSMRGACRYDDYIYASMGCVDNEGF